MKKIKKYLYLIVIALLIVLVTVVLSQDMRQIPIQTKKDEPLKKQSQNQDKTAEFERVLSRVFELRNSRDLDGLVKLADEVEKEWVKKDINYYTELMTQICGGLNSHDFGTDKQYVLARQCTKNALKHLEEMPVLGLPNLVIFLNGDLEYVTNQIPQENWAKDRRERTVLWGRVWQKFDNEIIENYDFELNRPIYRVNMTDEERKKAEIYNRQRFLQRDRKWFSASTQNYLIEAYSKPPFDMPELKEFLKKYVGDANLKSAVLAEVQNRMLENEN